MIVLEGKGVFGGIAMGKLSLYRRRAYKVELHTVEDSGRETARFEAAREKAVEELQGLYEKALKEVGEANAMIFMAHQMMLQDQAFSESVVNIIQNERSNAEYAVKTTGHNFAKIFSAMDDAYMKERAADVKDITERLLAVLAHGTSEKASALQEPVIIAADDLAPSETVQLDKNMILGFVTMHGSSNSHTAILARTMNIPAVIGVGEALKSEYDGADAIVDGFTGKVYIDPDEGTRTKIEAKRREDREKKELLKQLKGKPSETLDGRRMDIFANIGSFADVGAVLENDAGGIGLFRSEFIYLEREDYPTEEEQFKVYRQVAQTMAGRKVVIRTLDIGADKRIGYFDLPKEENPALGYRAVRICLDRPEVFKTQLRALYRASAFGNIAVMVPMITSLAEVREVKAMAGTVREELDREGAAYDKAVELGIMVETPAAVWISDELAKEVDFFSIGTNDLTQYTLAVDRQNPKLDRFYDPHHKAILRSIKHVVDSAHKNGIWVGICGELGADPALTETFLAMGVDELSVSPAYVLGLRKKVRETRVQDVKEAILTDLGC
ncbi:phosphoenolpyruvate--protein phosphotransferase [Gehongia tenuis]|uniref:Phosphoenolpyruvate-protein phosphotransferase n=1 Tax=Gehongia tenuis TaxID=2763655 RepID=A0A926D3S2_9FIRM|nr:phosphoenolpyruvate--protein phosphotransferase [Gehongia tenuis]MBC8530962.1 phosphoenolpyruvate--protein phosphotransferase [Gehongia tenuis]